MPKRKYKHKTSFFRKPRPEALGKRYTTWRTSVYKRDGYKCIACRSKGHLNAHHLDGWNWALSRRYDKKNGVTLCGQCHKLFHHEYGTDMNTRAQFESFLRRHHNRDLDI